MSRSATLPKPVPNLELLPELEAAVTRSLDASLILRATVGRALDEAVSKGSRAADLIALYRRVYDAEEAHRASMSKLNEWKDMLKFRLLPEAFEREQISTLTTAERDRVTVTQTVRASIPAEHRGEVYGWLRSTDHADLIVETVNAGTLSAFVKAELAEGRGVAEQIKVDVVDTAALTRGTKSTLVAA